MADRNAGDPVGMKIGLGQGLIDSGLICTERTTPLKEERDALERWMRPHSKAISPDVGEGRRRGAAAALWRRQALWETSWIAGVLAMALSALGSSSGRTRANVARCKQRADKITARKGTARDRAYGSRGVITN